MTAFHPDYTMTDRARTTPKTLRHAAELGVGEGLRYVALLIERVGYTILRDLLTPARGACPSCGTRIPGRW